MFNDDELNTFDKDQAERLPKRRRPPSSRKW